MTHEIKLRFRDTENWESDNHTFKKVNEFRFLGVFVPENSDIKS